MSPALPKLVFGTANIGPDLPSTPWHTHHTLAAATTILDAYAALGGDRLDTAAVYGKTDEHGTGGSERRLSEAGATGGRFVIDTKIDGFEPGSHADGKIRYSVEKSLKDLGVNKVNIMYLHMPDKTTPFLDILTELNELYKEGKYTLLGVSNYSAAQVDEMCELAKQHNLIAPAVYQGNYSLLCRRGEAELFPVLRKHGMAFYAYSPLAMGMLSGGAQKESLEAARTLPPGSRFHPDSRKADIWQRIWFKPGMFEAVRRLNALGRETGLTPTQLSLRWIGNHSALKAELGDAIVIGASSVEQLNETAAALREGPLDEKTAAAMEEVWKAAEPDAPEYCST